jgi:hypothetical protein
MRQYGGHIRKHGVFAFEIQPDAIEVEFTSGWVYRFSYEKTGAPRVERMKKLAEAGTGLSTFINRHVRNRYEFRRRKGEES